MIGAQPTCCWLRPQGRAIISQGQLPRIPYRLCSLRHPPPSPNRHSALDDLLHPSSVQIPSRIGPLCTCRAGAEGAQRHGWHWEKHDGQGARQAGVGVFHALRQALALSQIPNLCLHPSAQLTPPAYVAAGLTCMSVPHGCNIALSGLVPTVPTTATPNHPHPRAGEGVAGHGRGVRAGAAAGGQGGGGRGALQGAAGGGAVHVDQAASYACSAIRDASGQSFLFFFFFSDSGGGLLGVRNRREREKGALS